MAFALEKSFLHTLHRVSQLATDAFTRSLDGEDLTIRQVVVLAAISARENAIQTEIVRDTGVDRSTLTEIVRRLQQRGLITRRRSSTDARAVVVSVTRDGMRVLRKALSVFQHVEDDLLAVLPPEERRALTASLRSILGYIHPAGVSAEEQTA